MAVGISALLCRWGNISEDYRVTVYDPHSLDMICWLGLGFCQQWHCIAKTTTRRHRFLSSLSQETTDRFHESLFADHLSAKINYIIMSSPFRIDCIPFPKLPSSAAWRTAGVYTSGALVSSAPQKAARASMRADVGIDSFPWDSGSSSMPRCIARPRTMAWSISRSLTGSR